MLESIQSRFEFSIHLSVNVFPANQPRIQRNVWKVQNTTGRFLAPLHPSNFVRKILCLVPKVSNSWIVQKRSFLKIIWHRISIQTLLFQDVFAYPSKWRRKPWQGLLLRSVTDQNCSSHILSQPEVKITTNRDLLGRVFPRFTLATCICFECWLANCITYVCCDWQEWLLS